MSVSDDDITFAKELFAPLGPLTHRRMMGGLCLYLDGQLFATLDSAGTVFLKARGDFAQLLADNGARQFSTGKGGHMGYWTLPDEALDDPERASDWARRALAHL